MTAQRQPLRSARWVFVLWAALLLGLQVQGLGDAALFDVDEGAFSEATREMLASGDWGHTTLNGEPRFDKPMLTYWLQAASVRAFGLDEWALRLPSALASWAWAGALAWFAWQRWGLRAGIAAGSVLATCAGVMLIGRAATADALLNLWLCLATLDLWRALEQGDDGRGRLIDSRPLRRCAVWIGLGLLTKGPVAVLVPGATLLLWTGAEALQAGHQGAGQRLWQRLRPLLADPPAWALLLAIALPWYVYALQRHGMAFVDGFFWRHNLQRYGGTLEGHAGAWFYYLLLLPLLLFPWSALLLPVLGRWREAWRQPLPRFLLLWAGFVLVFFSGSGTKLPHYLLYGFTPLALLAGRELARRTAQGGTALARLPRTLLALSLVASPALGIAVTELVRQGLRAQKPAADAYTLQHALLAAPAPTLGLWLTAIGVGMLAWMLCVSSSADAAEPAGSPDSRWFGRAALAGALGVLFHVHGLLPWWADRLQAPVQTLARQARALNPPPANRPPATVVQWGLHLPSFALYLGQACPRRAPQAGELALVRSDQLHALAERHGNATGAAPGSRPWQALYSQPGLTLIRWIGVPPDTQPATALATWQAGPNEHR